MKTRNFFLFYAFWKSSDGDSGAVGVMPPLKPLVPLLLVASIFPSGIVCAYDGFEDHAHQHAMHAASRTTAEYVLPQVKLVRHDGSSISLPEEIDDGRPVILNFIFTSCTSVCPATSHIFSLVQEKLQEGRDKVHMLSISIDPEQDTPARIAEYAKKYGAGTQWDFYTGTLAASISVQKAFGAYPGNKMNHSPATFLRAAPGKPWVRLEGFATADELFGEYRRLVAAD